MMQSSDIRAFVARDWRLVADAKTDHWRAVKAQLGAAKIIAIADELRLQVQTARPDWPGNDARDADMRSHTRVSELLRRVAAFRAR